MPSDNAIKVDDKAHLLVVCCCCCCRCCCCGGGGRGGGGGRSRGGVFLNVTTCLKKVYNPSDNAIKVDDKAHLASSSCLRHNACTSFCQTMSPHV